MTGRLTVGEIASVTFGRDDLARGEFERVTPDHCKVVEEAMTRAGFETLENLGYRTTEEDS